MARKPRIHYPGAYYHVILRGNGGQDIFESDADRSKFFFLIQDGVERYGHRLHAYCLMSNHVHLLVEVGNVALPQIMQNLSFRYTRYFNAGHNRIGHLFQGRYKALLIDRDSYLLQLVRYIHCNPVRSGIAGDPGRYQWSSHHAYLGRVTIPWLTTLVVLSRFSRRIKEGRRLYQQFVDDGVQEPHRADFHVGASEARILGNDDFSEKALAHAEERLKSRLSIAGVINAISTVYAIEVATLIAPGKTQPAGEARAVAALLVTEAEGLSLTELAVYVGRDIASLSKAAGRIRKKCNSDRALGSRLALIGNVLKKMSKCQA